jgi:hypothetical protein
MVNLEKAFRFPTTDADWKRKVLIGGLLNIVPVVNFLSVGYAYGVFRKSFGQHPVSLSEWENWGDLFLQGLIVFLIALIYNIASLILFLIHPVLGLLAAIAVALLFPAAIARYAMTGNFSEAFRIGEIWARIRELKGDYFIAWLVMVAAFLVLGAIGMIPILGWIISAIMGFYAYISFAFLFGEILSRPGSAVTPTGYR